MSGPALCSAAITTRTGPQPSASSSTRSAGIYPTLVQYR